MKKEDISGFIVYLLVVGLAVVFCFTVLREHSTHADMTFVEYWIYVVGAVVAGIVVNAILFELAHVLGAKIGGYDILSVAILGLTFYKTEEGKWKVGLKNFNGLTGETVIYPKEGKKPANPRPFLLFGTLFMSVEIVLVILLFSILTVDTENIALSNVGYFILTIGVVGAVILLYNIIPMKLDTITDGYRLTMLSNPKNKEAFNELLKVEYHIAHGDPDVEIKTFETITNFTADLNMNKVYVLLDKRDYKQAEELIDLIIHANTEDVSYKTWLRAKAQKLYINLIQSETIEDAKKYFEKNADLGEVREISHDISMPSIRTYILVSGLVERSHSETVYTLNNIIKAYKATPKNRRATEMSLYNEALNKVMAANPKWEDLKGYILEENK